MKAGNKKTYKVPVDREWFLKVLQERNCSIRQLGAVPEIERTEKTIRRSLKKGEMAPDLLVRIAKHLNVHPDYLAGVYAKSLASVENTYIFSQGGAVSLSAQIHGRYLLYRSF